MYINKFAKNKASEMSIYWPKTENDFIFMSNMKKKNKEARWIPAEQRFLWKLDKLKKDYWIKFTRQAVFWTRIFDFWCHDLWIAIEIDWNSHNTRKEYDNIMDKFHNHCWILVYRVRNFNEWDAYEAIENVKKAEKWIVRRYKLWLPLSENNKKLALDIINAPSIFELYNTNA